MLRLAVGLVLIVVPMLELLLLIKIGQSIGAWATLALVLTTALAGAIIVSRQSLSVVQRTLEALSEGRPPVEPVVDGLFLMLAGALLVMPGLGTDVVALVLLVPPLRRLIARASMRWLVRRARVHIEAFDGEEDAVHRGPFEPPGGRSPRRPDLGDGPIIEGEFERVDERPVDPPGGAGHKRRP